NATKVREIGTKEAMREQAVRVAQLDKEKQVGEQTALLEQQAQIKEAQRQQAIKIAELDRDQKVGEQRAVFERESQVAEADREKRALLEAPAKAEKARTIVDAEAQAAKARIDAEAQAAAVFARLDAEARGQYEILAKKGEGLKKIIEACGSAQASFQMLMLEHM